MVITGHKLLHNYNSFLVQLWNRYHDAAAISVASNYHIQLRKMFERFMVKFPFCSKDFMLVDISFISMQTCLQHDLATYPEQDQNFPLTLIKLSFKINRQFKDA